MENDYENCAWVSFDELERFIADCLANAGVPREDAEIVGRVLIESDKRGIDSHGIGRLFFASLKSPLLQNKFPRHRVGIFIPQIS